MFPVFWTAKLYYKIQVAHVKRTQKYFGSPSQVKFYKLNLVRGSTNLVLFGFSVFAFTLDIK